MKNQITRFLERKDDVLYKGKLGLLCNQTSFNFDINEYLWHTLAKRGNLKRIFIPEHGLFAELQDQLPLISTEIYKYLNLDVEYLSLYGNSENSLIVDPKYLSDLDVLIIDIQDVGSRYYTFATTVSYIFDVLKQADLALEIYIIDRPNPAGRQVEGTILTPEYESFVGRRGLPHRHGLTIGELCLFYQKQIEGKFKLNIIKLPDYHSDNKSTWKIFPSPNMPGPFTPLMYSGQCLLEGTNISEGRGTTRPFEIFGAPYMKWIHQKQDIPIVKHAILRPLRFIPTFHKFAGEICDGFQIHVTSAAYHSLAHSLKLIRYIQNNSGGNFKWRKEIYEFREDRPAIEILVADQILLEYLHNKCHFNHLKQFLFEEEQKWISVAAQFLLYTNPLIRGEI